MQECPNCGLEINDPTLHSSAECGKQRAINEINLAKEPGCRWCGVQSRVHREGCPRHKSDKTTVSHEDKTTIITRECGYCGAKNTSSYTDNGPMSGCSFGGAEHKMSRPYYVWVRN